MATDWTPDTLDALPRLGWAQEPSPISEVPALADSLGLSWLGIKRDDLGTSLHGGTKVRKLDFLLATERLREANTWLSVGAIGSGHLAALRAAAEELDRQLIACCYWEPLSAGVEENLAFTVSGPTELRYHASFARLLLRRPGALLSNRSGGVSVVTAGASDGAGVLGLVRGGLELAEQIRSDELPRPDRVYLPLGSGGTTAGLALGLALGGMPIPLQAVATVPRVVATARRQAWLRQEALTLLREAGLQVPANLELPTVHIDRSQLGRGYAHPTDAGLRAIEQLRPADVALEAVYSAKAMAALIADAKAGGGAERVLFWLTPHGGGLPKAADWRERLPRALRKRLELARAGRLRRRQLMKGAAWVAGGVVLGARVGFYPALPSFDGRVLADWEAHVVAAAAEAIVPVGAGRMPTGASAEEVAANVDRFLEGMPSFAIAEVHGLMLLLEHGTGLDLDLPRFTRLTPPERLAFIERLHGMGSVFAQAARGIRDLCYLGFYQDPRTWPGLGYEGPTRGSLPTSTPRGDDGFPRPQSRYDELIAPLGQEPPGRIA